MFYYPDAHDAHDTHDAHDAQCMEYLWIFNYIYPKNGPVM